MHRGHPGLTLPRAGATSQALEIRNHRLALSRVRKPAASRSEIVRHVLRIARAWNNGRHCRVSQKELEKELRPCRRIEVPGPLRNRLAPDGSEDRFPAER